MGTTTRSRLVCCLALLGTGGCSASLSPSVDAHPTRDGPVDLSAYFSSVSCGGTVSLTGMTPDGPFVGDSVSVDGYYGGATGVSVAIGDSRTGWGLLWHNDWFVDAGTSLSLPATSFAVNATFITSPSETTFAAGEIDITAAANPQEVADAGVTGMLQATMTFTQTGFALSGAIASPYCKVGVQLGPSD